MLPNRPHQQRMVDVVEHSLDVELDHPVVVPAPPPYPGYRIERRAPGAIPIGIGMELGFEDRFQDTLDHSLRHPVGHCGHAEHPHTA